MPINPNIALQVRQPEIESPLNALAKVSQVQGVMNQNRLADLAFAESQRKQQRQNALMQATRNAFDPTTNRIDPNKYRGALAEIGDFEGLQSFEKSQAEQARVQRAAEKERLAAAKSRIELIGQVAGAAKDPQSYAAGLQVLRNAGIDVSGIPDQYDPSYVEQARNQALTAAQQLEQTWKQKGYDLDVDKFGYQKQNDAANRGVTIRGQNLADARAREANEAARGKIVTTADGGVVLVDDRAGTAKPVTDAEGKQVIGKMAGQLTPKQISDAKGKLQTIRILRKQLDNLKKVRENLGAFSQGIVAGRNPLSEAGSNYDKALAALQTTIRQLTRTPGEGAMSDYESRMAQAQLPMRADFPSSIDQGIAQIEDLANVIETGYSDMVGSAPGRSSAKAPAATKQSTPNIDDLLKKYGD